MRRCAAALGAAALLFARCADDSFDYLAESFIDTVLVGESVRNNQPASVVHVYPAGCNHFERFESERRTNGLYLSALYHFYYRGRPCAHGTGLDTTSYALSFPDTGLNVLEYRRGEDDEVVLPIYVTPSHRAQRRHARRRRKRGKRVRHSRHHRGEGPGLARAHRSVPPA